MDYKHKYEEDYLNRTKIAKQYCDFLKNLTSHMTIALDSPWGTGKSKVVEFMKKELKDEIFITYNAWENDYTNEAFLSFMSNFFSQAKDKKYLNENENDIRTLKTIAFKAGKYILPSLIQGGMNIVVGSEATKNLENGTKEIINAFKDIPEQLVNDTFKTLDESKKSREKFTKEFQKTIQNILKEKNKKQFIIIIDELDRCKPTFAIELLENIKHLFEIEEVTFFIAVDKIQLAESLKVIYGNNFDTRTYLQRFFDLSIHLNKKNIEKYFADKIQKNFPQIENYSWYKLDEIFDFAIYEFKLSLREFEQIISQVYFLSKINNNDYLGTLFLFTILKVKNIDIYKHLKTYIERKDNSSWAELIEHLQDIYNNKFGEFHTEIKFITINQRLIAEGNNVDDFINYHRTLKVIEQLEESF